MSDINSVMSDFQRHADAIRKANELNKGPIFDALAAAGITTVTVEFDGYGDSGQIENVTAAAGDASADLPAVSITIHSAKWGSETLDTKDLLLASAIEELCYDYLSEQHGGWENNDGAFGDFAFDVASRSVILTFSERYTDTNTFNHVF